MIQFCLFQTFVFLVVALIVTPLTAILYRRLHKSENKLDKVLCAIAEISFIFVWLQVIAGVAVTLSRLIF